MRARVRVPLTLLLFYRARRHFLCFFRHFLLYVPPLSDIFFEKFLVFEILRALQEPRKVFKWYFFEILTAQREPRKALSGIFFFEIVRALNSKILIRKW